MKVIYLISCCKEKLPHSAEAQDLYQSDGFKKCLAEAFSYNPDAILILSAKHHIVELNQVLEPYDVCLSDQSVNDQKKWAEICIAELKLRFNLKEDKFVILASESYYGYLIGQGRIENYEIPFITKKISCSSVSSNLSVIQNFLHNAGKAYCDDCLSKLTGITPRQQINQISNKYFHIIHRDDFGECCYCGKCKIIRSVKK